METYCPGFNASTALTGPSALYSLMEQGNGTVNFNACNCTQWHLDTMDATSISVLRIITSLLSIVGSASIILSVLLTGKLNAAEVHPLFILSVGDFILSVLWMIGGIVWLAPGKGGWAGPDSTPHTGMCYVLAIATTMAEMVTFMLTTVYAQSALLRIREVYLNRGVTLNKKDSRKHLRNVMTIVVYIISWVLPLIVVLSVTESKIGIDVTNEGCWCLLDFFNLRPDDGLISKSSHFNVFATTQATIIGVSFALSSGLLLLWYILTFVYARKVVQMQRQLLEEGKAPVLIKTIVVRLSLFVVIFVVCGLPSFIASIAVWSEEERLHLDELPDRVILYIHAIFSPMQGILNAIVYGWSRREFRRAVNIQERYSHNARSRGGTAKYESLNARSGSKSSSVVLTPTLPKP